MQPLFKGFPRFVRTEQRPHGEQCPPVNRLVGKQCRGGTLPAYHAEVERHRQGLCGGNRNNGPIRGNQTLPLLPVVDKGRGEIAQFGGTVAQQGNRPQHPVNERLFVTRRRVGRGITQNQRGNPRIAGKPVEREGRLTDKALPVVKPLPRLQPHEGAVRVIRAKLYRPQRV